MKTEKKELPVAIREQIAETLEVLEDRPKLAHMFSQCYPNTLLTTTQQLEDGTSYVFTGDIPAMWLRDSTAQVRHYIPLASNDFELQEIIEGRQVKLLVQPLLLRLPLLHHRILVVEPAVSLQVKPLVHP